MTFCSKDQNLVLKVLSSKEDQGIFNFYINMTIINNLEKQFPIAWGSYRIVNQSQIILNHHKKSPRYNLSEFNLKKAVLNKRELKIGKFELDSQNCEGEGMI